MNKILKSLIVLLAFLGYVSFSFAITNTISLGASGSYMEEYTVHANGKYADTLRLSATFNGGFILRKPISNYWRLSILGSGGLNSYGSLALVYQSKPFSKLKSIPLSVAEGFFNLFYYILYASRSRYLIGPSASIFTRNNYNNLGWGVGFLVGLRTGEWHKFYFLMRHHFLLANDSFIINRGKSISIDYSWLYQLDLSIVRRF